MQYLAVIELAAWLGNRRTLKSPLGTRLILLMKKLNFLMKWKD